MGGNRNKAYDQFTKKYMLSKYDSKLIDGKNSYIIVYIESKINFFV